MTRIQDDPDQKTTPLFPDVPFGKRLFEKQILFFFSVKKNFLHYFHIEYFSYLHFCFESW